jgi:adenylate cyclase
MGRRHRPEYSDLQTNKAGGPQRLRTYPQRHRSLALQFGHDQRASALSFLSLELWLSGYPDRASREMERALAFVEELNHANSRIFVLVWGAALLAALRRDPVAAGEYARTAVSLSKEHGSRHFLATGDVFCRRPDAMSAPRQTFAGDFGSKARICAILP